MKDQVIFVGRDGRPSMKKVYSKMSKGTLVVRSRILNTGKTYYRVYSDNNSEVFVKDKEAPVMNDKVVIRWGTREDIHTNERTVVYNKSEAIKNATDKKLSRKIMADAGVAVPKAVTPDNVADNDFPVIARPKTHAKGKNFVILKTKHELVQHYHIHEKAGWYYSAFIDKDREFRVHVAHGKVLALMEKPNPGNGNIPWNRALNHDAFEYVGYEKYNDKGIKAAIINAIKACNSLGLDFGGVDVMLKGNNAYVLEVNTSPTLNSSDYVSSRWSKYFNWLFSSDKRREKFNRFDYEEAKNFFFWNEQLEK